MVDINIQCFIQLINVQKIKTNKHTWDVKGGFFDLKFTYLKATYEPTNIHVLSRD